VALFVVGVREEVSISYGTCVKDQEDAPILMVLRRIGIQLGAFHFHFHFHFCGREERGREKAFNSTVSRGYD
jgi:hypothetical protein